MIRFLIISVIVLVHARFLFAVNFTHRMEFSSQKSTEESQPHSSLTHRQEIRELTWTQLQELRDAFRTAMDNGRFAEVARDHGYPNWQCPHGDVRFLPWHRRVLRRLETALGGISLPYWDWTKPGEPVAITNRTYVNASGVILDNPLFSSIRPDGKPATLGDGWHVNTDMLATAVDLALDMEEFTNYAVGIESPHNQVHVQTGGDMIYATYSAFVPLFWFHHSFVDKVWYDWQLLHPDAEYPEFAKGPMTDSEGTYNGIEEIENMSGWERAPPLADDVAADLVNNSTNRKFVLVLEGLKSTIDPERIEIHCLNELMAVAFSFGMSQPTFNSNTRSIDVTATLHNQFLNVSISQLLEAGACEVSEVDPQTNTRLEIQHQHPQMSFGWINSRRG